MNKILIILTILLFSCEYRYKKPFVIISKYNTFEAQTGFCAYQYQDANGRIESFHDQENKYEVGDTLK